MANITLLVLRCKTRCCNQHSDLESDLARKQAGFCGCFPCERNEKTSPFPISRLAGIVQPWLPWTITPTAPEPWLGEAQGMAVFHVEVGRILKGKHMNGATGFAQYIARESPEKATQIRFLCEKRTPNGETSPWLVLRWEIVDCCDECLTQRCYERQPSV